MAQWLLDEICDRLTDAGLFRHAIKRDYKRITSLLSKESERTIERYCKDERESGEACTAAEFATFHKFLSAYMDWFKVIEGIAQLPNGDNTYEGVILDNAE